MGRSAVNAALIGGSKFGSPNPTLNLNLEPEP